MDASLPPLIRLLLEPQRYPHAAQQVELVQTHISWVLLAGEFAYKIKKPLKLPFLDFSTLELRQTCCIEELRLNRRFAPDIYLDVVAIFGTPDSPRFEGPGTPIEYAVKMRRFDEAGRLDRTCARGELLPAHLSDLAKVLVAFHADAHVAPQASRFGSPAEVMAPMLDNFHDLHGLLSEGDQHARLAALRSWTGAQYQQLAPLLAARKTETRVRECHGDLHLGNLVLINGRVRMFDCIEFNEDLRWIDVASDIAFTYVDLLDNQQPGLANWFVDQVLARSGDYGAAQVLRFYAVYRAMVRAKVAALRSQQSDSGNNEAMAYIALAERLVAPPPARLVITHGLAGCGKTVASGQLLQDDARGCTIRLRSDVERKRLFGLASNQHSDSGTDSGLYTAQSNQQTYGHLLGLARLLLGAGWSVVVDAAFLRSAERARFHALAKAVGVTFEILAPQAAPDELRRRIQERTALGNDASEATLEVLESQSHRIEALDADERTHLLATGQQAADHAA